MFLKMASRWDWQIINDSFFPPCILFEIEKIGKKKLNETSSSRSVPYTAVFSSDFGEYSATDT